MSQLSDYLKYKIIYLHEENVGIREISRRLNIARNTVRLWLRRFEETGNVQKDRFGPKPVMFTPASERHQAIVSKHVENPFTSTRSTAVQYNISMKTVRKHLHAAGLKQYKPARKIQLTAAHRQARVRFAQEYLDFNWEEHVVIFTDEKTFKSDKDGRKILWRKKGERYNENCLLPCRTSGRITLGYWGWMSSMGPGELVEVGGRFNSHQYLEILRDVMLPTVRACYPDTDIYFVQDNCSIHRAAVVQNWLASQEGVKIISWPSKSPDLNPIENLWGQMILNWDSSEVRTKDNLAQLVTSTWELMRGSDTCWNMVCGMRSRLQQVIERDGAPLRY